MRPNPPGDVPPSSAPGGESPVPRAGFGFLAMALATLLFGLALLEAAGWAGDLPLPATWYVHRPLWLLLAGLFFAAGWKLQSGMTRGGGSAGWQPAQPGQRFQRVVLYTREGCHLCEEAHELLAHYAEYLPEIDLVDIDFDPRLKELYGETIPVVECDGQVRFKGIIDDRLLRRLIEGTPPLTEDDAASGG